MTPLNARARLAGRLSPPAWLAQLALRLAVAVPFLKSGLLKWDGLLHLNDVAVTLFTDEFQLHLPGGPYPFPAPAAMAYLSACGEVALPLLLIAGLGTRLAAWALMGMIVVIQLTVPEGWPVHVTWFAMALAIAAGGPGGVSLDHLIRRRPGS
jgi:putative oxidoreductase